MDLSPSHPSTPSSQPMTLAEEVESLMKMPQHLCKQRGICCRVATFKGLLPYEKIQDLMVQDDMEGEMARDFVSVFLPFESQAEVSQLAPEFVERVRARAAENGMNPDDAGFFHCKFVLEDGRCGVHEDRPVGCRTYPFPHEKTIFHPGCGFEAQSHENWGKIKAILESLGMSSDLSTYGNTSEDGEAEETTIDPNSTGI